MNPPRGLKLRAEDETDLQVIGACLQDALVPITDMIWLRDERRFAMVVNRFMWEVPPEQLPPDEGDGGEEVHNRIHGILSFQKVRSVRVRDIDQNRRGEVLSLLALRSQANAIDMEFAGGGTVRMEVDGIDCYLEDVGAPWPTRWRPGHADVDSPPNAA